MNRFLNASGLILSTLAAVLFFVEIITQMPGQYSGLMQVTILLAALFTAMVAIWFLMNRRDQEDMLGRMGKILWGFC